jgi:hypothetical protein
MECTTDGIALYVTDREVCTQVRTISAEHLGSPTLAAKDNHSAVEEVHADDLSATNCA